MMHGKAIWKPVIARGLQRPLEPTAASMCWHWFIAHDHKTQSFMKNRGQQKWLDKALYVLIPPISLRFLFMLSALRLNGFKVSIFWYSSKADAC